MPVDSFKFLPRSLAAFYQATNRQPELPIPWTPLNRPVSQSKFGLITSGGLYLSGIQAPFDVEREKQEPTWGDPTFRRLPVDTSQEQVAVSHLHLNPQDILVDFNILLPLQRFRELVAAGRVGGLAAQAYSFMGFQGYPPDTRPWQDTYGPQVAAELKAEGADCALLVPS
jgi:D-proline reductase (dithiol) PrdB